MGNSSSGVRAVKDGDKVVIHISGDFDYKLRREFRSAYAAYPAEASFIVNLRGVQFIDSSGLGMLVMLREHAGGDDAKVTLTNCQPTVRQALKFSQFDDLFVIL